MNPSENIKYKIIFKKRRKNLKLVF
jgi:hypothetical protein